MSKKARIVVLGAGFAGLTLCTRLNALADSGAAEVTLVERNHSLSVGGLFQFALQGLIDPTMIAVPYAGGTALRCSGVRFLQDDVTGIDLAARQVQTRATTLDYDYLVIASGARYASEEVPGLADGGYNVCMLDDVLRLRTALQAFAGGTVVMSIPRTPYKCPTVPQEYLLVVETMLRMRRDGVRERSRLLFVTEADGPFPMTGFFNERFARYGIETEIYAPLREVDAGERLLHFGTGRDGRCLAPIRYELLMATHPLAAHPVFQPLCDSTGMIPADPRTLRTAWDGVWALGDCAAMRLASGPLHPKAGAFAMTQAEALARNLIALVQSGGTQDAGAENLGIAQCDAEVGNHEGASISVNLMGGPKSRFELGPVSTAAVQDKLSWISDCLDLWFQNAPRYRLSEKSPEGSLSC
ncbi:MAG: FAD-dependent oxidoreductase [Xanthomonadales bacterium]|jgi:sulfide:quinone oxidoreductase|nr:FAD-dependent oxidoreductase [Xanthomonadales bacterium]